jgi:16S rRNA (cytidine1402-2'-O)-methyltransferase
MSTPEQPAGTLYIVSTPIGNLGDLTFRALEVLKGVDHIACEDTRVTLKLLNHYGIKKHLISFHAASSGRAVEKIARFLRAGQNVAYVTDSGTPTVSDPGAVLVAGALEENAQVVPVPGPSAVHAALAASGIPYAGYRFLGFVSSKSSRRKKRLAELAGSDEVLVFYESPHRILAFLEDVLETMGDLPGCVSKEVSKRYERHYRGMVSEIRRRIQEDGPRGEYTVILDTRSGGAKSGPDTRSGGSRG